MATVFQGDSPPSPAFTKRISTHAAAALLLFSFLQIAIVARMGGPILLYLAMIVVTGIFVVKMRKLEYRWQMREGGHQSRDQLAPLFRRDTRMLWIMSVVGASLWVPITMLTHLFIH